MRTVNWLTGVCLTLFGTMAMAQSVSYDYDRAANFSKYRTYAWTRGTELPDVLNHARVVRAIDAALVAKGVGRVDAADNPAALIAYHVSFDTHLQISARDYGLGPFGFGPDRVGSAMVEPVQVGTLVVDIADAQTHAIVWRGRASSDVSPSDNTETREKKINKATAKMFRNFPPSPRASAHRPSGDTHRTSRASDVLRSGDAHNSLPHRDMPESAARAPEWPSP
jgi:Domain of unknown function (DUF4136)